MKMISIIILASCVYLSHAGSFVHDIVQSQCVACAAPHIGHVALEPPLVQFSDFDANEFNGLGWVDDVFALQSHVENEVDFETMVNKAGQIIIKHGLKEYVGIANLHKHFDLSNNEKMVFFINDQQSTAAAAALTGKVISNKDYNSCDTDSHVLVPYMFKLGDKQWLPLQYICDIKGSELESLNVMMQNGLFDNFLNDISNFILKNKATNIIGLYWRYHKYSTLVKQLSNDDNNDNTDFHFKLLEKTSIKDRIQTFEKVLQFEESYLTTQYMFESVDCVSESYFDTSINQECIMVPPTGCTDSYCQWDPFRGHVKYHTVTDQNQ